MPELPDVETFRRYLESTVLRKKVKGVDVKSLQILDGVSADKLCEKLVSKEFLGARRYGKYLFANVEDEFWLVFHFGMTGSLKYFKEMEDEPEHDRFLITFENGFHLAFDCQRKFGRIAVTPKVEDYIKKKRLGADALEVDFKSFKRLLESRRGSAKSTLMNQQVIAGVGNIYSDEILYQSGIHPKTKMNTLSEDNLKSIFSNMKRILKIAIEHRANPDELPGTYLIPNRSEGAKCPKCSGEVKTLKMNGRTAYFCPSCQKQ
jgi:formamidopyrimidine-DNA glycosylase